MGNRQIHVSHIRRFYLCGEQFRRILAGDRSPPGVAAIIGTGSDTAHKADLTSKMETGRLCEASFTQDLVRDTVNLTWEGGVLLPKGTNERRARGEAVDRAVRIDGVRHHDLAPQIEPTSVARKWVIDLEGYGRTLAGEFDNEEEDALRDLKTSGKHPEKTAADKSMQLDMYALAKRVHDGALPGRVCLDYVLDIAGRRKKDGTPGKASTSIKILESTRTDAHCEGMLRRIANYIECMEKGVFHPCDPDHWVCNPKWCGFFDSCPYPVGRVQVGYGS